MPFGPPKSCLAEMPSPVGRGQASIVHEPDINEWSGLLVNEQEVAVHPVQAVDVGAMATSASNSIELTPLWPKNGSPSHKGWPADHSRSTKHNRTDRGPPPPPPPSSCPPAVPQKSKNQPPPAPPPLPATSSKEHMHRKQQLRVAQNSEVETKGPAPQPPVTSQPIRSSTSVSRGLQVEEDDLIQFSNGQKQASTLVNGSVSTSTSVAQLKKQLRSRLSLNDEDVDPDLNVDGEDDMDDDESISSKTADEQMDYLESLEPCPCYAKCCLDSIITLFCVTLLG